MLVCLQGYMEMFRDMSGNVAQKYYQNSIRKYTQGIIDTKKGWDKNKYTENRKWTKQ